jgi:SagB-type dehydrogenase family enzyme
MREYGLQFAPRITLQTVGSDRLILHDGATLIRVVAPSYAICSVLDNLRDRRRTANELCAHALSSDVTFPPAHVYRFIFELEKKGLLAYSVSLGNDVLAALEPLSLSPRFSFRAVQAFGSFLSSRFASLRRAEQHAYLESPLGHARIKLFDSRCFAAFGLLMQPQSPMQLANQVGGIDVTTAESLLELFFNSSIAFPCDEAGRIAEDNDPDLVPWGFHDLLFHARTRLGRNIGRVGATYPLPQLRCEPTFKPNMSKHRIALPLANQGDERNRASFFDVLASRRSRRGRGDSALSIESLGRFLYHVARIDRMLAENSEGALAAELTLRPIPSGGALHELEFYLAISQCQGLEVGFYHYDPRNHELEFLSPLLESHIALISHAQLATGSSGVPDVLITLSARIKRVAWKYESLAYALILKNVGAAFQQMYLVATAMGFAPCALGTGDAELFAEVSTERYEAEAAVGEFMLSGS